MFPNPRMYDIFCPHFRWKPNPHKSVLTSFFQLFKAFKSQRTRVKGYDDSEDVDDFETSSPKKTSKPAKKAASKPAKKSTN
jgi:hypothetical protein